MTSAPEMQHVTRQPAIRASAYKNVGTNPAPSPLASSITGRGRAAIWRSSRFQVPFRAMFRQLLYACMYFRITNDPAVAVWNVEDKGHSDSGLGGKLYPWSISASGCGDAKSPTFKHGSGCACNRCESCRRSDAREDSCCPHLEICGSVEST